MDLVVREKVVHIFWEGFLVVTSNIIERGCYLSEIILRRENICGEKLASVRGEYRPFLRSVTAFGRTKIGAQILIDQLKI